MVDNHFALLVTELETKLYIMAQGSAFLLRQRRHHRKQDFSFAVQGIYAFLLKIHCNVFIPQLPDVIQRIHRIPSKAADGFGDNHINLAIHAIFDHLIELSPFFGIGAADALIGINARHFPLWIFADVFIVIVHLRLIALKLLITAGADSTVGGNSQLSRCIIHLLQSWLRRYDRHVFCDHFS